MSDKYNLRNQLISIAILLLAVASGFVYMNRGEGGSSEDEAKLFMHRSRFAATRLSWTYDGTTLPPVFYRDPVTDTDHTLGSEDRSIVVALGRTGCSPCQARELRNLDSLYQELDASFPIVGLYYNDLHEDDGRYRYEVMQIKRMAAVDFPIGYTKDIRFADYMTGGYFPTIFLLEGNTVVSSFVPVPSDDLFSFTYMKALEQLVHPGFPAPDLPVLDGSLEDHGMLSEWPLRSLAGDSLNLDDFRGTTVLLNRWATWCAPCLKELPALQALYEKHEDITLVLVSGEDQETVRRYIEQREYTFPVYTSESPPPDVFKSGSIPVTFVIDPKGRVVLRHTGIADWNDDRVVVFLKRIASVASG